MWRCRCSGSGRRSVKVFSRFSVSIVFCFGKVGKMLVWFFRIFGSRIIFLGKVFRVLKRILGILVIKVLGMVIWEDMVLMLGLCWKFRSFFVRSRGGRSSR